MMPPTWFACEYPERPTDAYVLWHHQGCRGCRIAAEALLIRHPDDPHVQWLNRWVTGPSRPLGPETF